VTYETLALENARPFLKGKIRRDYGRTTLVALAEYLKEQFRAGLVRRALFLCCEALTPRREPVRVLVEQRAVFDYRAPMNVDEVML
jgi:hypothetical protein